MHQSVSKNQVLRRARTDTRGGDHKVGSIAGAVVAWTPLHVLVRIDRELGESMGRAGWDCGVKRKSKKEKKGIAGKGWEAKGKEVGVW